MTTNRWFAWALISLVILANWMPPRANAADDPPKNVSLLEKSLAIDYWDNSRFAKFENDSPLSEDEEAELHRLVARLNTFDRRVFYASEAQPVSTMQLIASPDNYRGKLIRWKGDITEHQAPAQDAGNVHVCLATSTDGDVAIYAAEVPQNWKPNGVDNRSIGVEGVFVKIDERAGKPTPIIAAAKIEWMPNIWDPPEINYGMSVMGVLDMDVSLLDNITHREPLTSRETAAFYRLMASLRSTNGKKLVSWAERHATRHRDQWGEIAKTAEGNERLLAQEVEKLARKEIYSVAPFFNAPENHVGELVAFDGLVRRALRVEVASDADASASGLDHYYELALFTSDSKNNPVMFCVLELPEGFPVGNEIREPVRIAGFFFKNWRYTSRASDGQLRLAPLFVSYGPLELVPPPPEPIWGWLTGIGFVALVLALWLAIWLRSRADGKFEAGTLARIRDSAEPLAADEADLIGDLTENTGQASGNDSPNQ